MEEKNRKFRSYLNFDRSEYDAYLFLIKRRKSETIWDTMSSEPVVADIDFEEDSQSVKLMMISLAILSVEKK